MSRSHQIQSAHDAKRELGRSGERVRLVSELPANDDGVPPGCGRIGPYQLGFKVGTGGMASVYLARAPDRELVAVKVVLPHLTKERRAVDMFLDEARISSRSTHPHVVKTLDFGKDGATHYLVLEYIVGESLGHLLHHVATEKRIEDAGHPFLAARIVANLAEALQSVHELADEAGCPLDVVHRDISPQNLFVLYDGTVRIADFGIAWSRSRLERTTGGMLKGKLPYIAPEQFVGDGIDQRADVWALGVVMWELLTGERLFKRASPCETYQAVKSAAIPAPSSLNPRVPPELDFIVLLALTRAPMGRYQTAGDFACALETFLSDSGSAVSDSDVGAFMQTAFRTQFTQKQALMEQVRNMPEQEVSGVWDVPSVSRIAVSLPAPTLRSDLTDVLESTTLVDLENTEPTVRCAAPPSGVFHRFWNTIVATFSNGKKRQQ